MNIVLHSKTIKSHNSSTGNTIALEQNTELQIFEVTIYNEATNSVHNLFPAYYTLESALEQYNRIVL